MTLLFAALWALGSAAAPSALAQNASSQDAAELFRAGRLSQAAAAYERQAREEGDSQAWLDAGVLYRDLGEDEKSLAMFENAAVARPNDPGVQAAYGWAALRGGRLERSEAAFRTALEQDPGHAEALLGRGRLLELRGRPGEAVAAYSALARERPEYARAWLQLGRILAAQGDPTASAEAFRGALRADPGAVETRCELGEVLKRLGKYDEAWAQYALVVQAQPSHQEAVRMKRELARKLTGPVGHLLPGYTPRKPGEVVAAPGRDAMPDIRVGIGTGPLGKPQLKRSRAFVGTGPFRLSDPETGRILAEGPGQERFLVRRASGGGFEVVGRRGRLARFGRVLAVEAADRDKDALLFERVSERGDPFAGGGRFEKQFKGRVEIQARGGGFYLVNQLPLEDYVYGVVTNEMPSRFPPEALRAQAVLARTHSLYVTRHFPTHRRHGYDLCDGQHCQVYGGADTESPAGREAADATRGQILRYEGRLAQTPYSSNCGGHTQGSGEIPGWTELPYLQGRADDDEAVSATRGPWDLDQSLRGRSGAFCNLESGMPLARYRWVRVVPADDMQERARRLGALGTLRRLLVVRRSASGYANELWFEGSSGKVRLAQEHRIRSILGLGSVQSTYFVVETERDERGRPSEFVFHGAGWGHGVGLCQYGAAGRALKGRDYREIIAHYFPGTALDTLPYGAFAGPAATVPAEGR